MVQPKAHIQEQGNLTGLVLGYWRGSLIWSPGNLIGFLSSVARKDLAKVTSLMMTFSKPEYRVSSVKKASVAVSVGVSVLIRPEKSDCRCE